MKRNLPLIIAGVFAVLFLILLVLLLTLDVGNIAPLEGKVGLSTLNESVRNAIGGPHMTLYKIAKWTGYLAILSAVGFALFGVVQLVKRRSLARVDRELLVLAGLYIVALACYLFFEVFVINVRPVILPNELKPESSFPSSHTLLAITFFGSAALLCRRYLEKRELRLCAQVILILLLLITTVCRLLSGVHWLTDILGGVFLGLALLCLFAGILDRIGQSSEQ